MPALGPPRTPFSACGYSRQNRPAPIAASPASLKTDAGAAASETQNRKKEPRPLLKGLGSFVHFPKRVGRRSCRRRPGQRSRKKYSAQLTVSRILPHQ